MGSIGWFKKWFKKPVNEYEAKYREEKQKATHYKESYFKLKGQLKAVLREASVSEKEFNLGNIRL
jgi:ribosomal protein S4